MSAGPRRALSLAGLAVVSACASPSRESPTPAGERAATQPPSGSGTVTILHTNDRHGRHRPFRVAPGNATAQTGDPGRDAQELPRSGELGGFAQLATTVGRVRDARGAGNVLLVDGGDTFADDLLGNLTRGEAVIGLMNDLGYQFMALGNHDFDYGAERTRELQAVARFPMRAANVTEARTGRPFLGDPTLVLEAGGVRVGLLALGYHNTALTGSPDNVRGLAFGSGIEAARRLVPALRSRSDVVVVLSHQGSRIDRRLAREVPGIDVIVGAHSHDLVAPPERVGDSWLAQALSDGAVLGELTLDVRERRVEGMAHVLWSGEVPADAAVAARVEALRAPHRDSLQSVIATATAAIGRRYRSASPFDRLVGDLLREETGAEVAFLPGVGYGVTLQPGPITREMLVTLLPHPSAMVTMRLTGAQILEVLEQSATNQRPADEMEIVGGMIQTSGLAHTTDLRRPVGRRVRDVAVGGAPLDPAREYRVVTHAGMLAGIHRYRTFAGGRDVQRTERRVAQVVEERLRRRGRVGAPRVDDVVLLRD